MKFHLNGCSHCEAIKPEWAKLVSFFKEENVEGLVIGEMERSEVPEEFGLTKCPQVNLYKAG